VEGHEGIREVKPRGTEGPNLNRESRRVWGFGKGNKKDTLRVERILGYYLILEMGSDLMNVSN